MVAKNVFVSDHPFQSRDLTLKFIGQILYLQLALLFELVNLVIEPLYQGVVSLRGNAELSLDLAVEEARLVELRE